VAKRCPRGTSFVYPSIHPSSCLQWGQPGHRLAHTDGVALISLPPWPLRAQTAAHSSSATHTTTAGNRTPPSDRPHKERTSLGAPELLVYVSSLYRHLCLLMTDSCICSTPRWLDVSMADRLRGVPLF